MPENGIAMRSRSACLRTALGRRDGLPCRRSRVRVPSSALKSPANCTVTSSFPATLAALWLQSWAGLVLSTSSGLSTQIEWRSVARAQMSWKLADRLHDPLRRPVATCVRQRAFPRADCFLQKVILRRPNPWIPRYHGISTATGSNPRQPFSPVSAVFGAGAFATGCHRSSGGRFGAGDLSGTKRGVTDRAPAR